MVLNCLVEFIIIRLLFKVYYIIMYVALSQFSPRCAKMIQKGRRRVSDEKDESVLKAILELRTVPIADQKECTTLSSSFHF